MERPLRLKGVDPERAYLAREIKAVKDEAERSDTASPVIKRLHKAGTEPDPLPRAVLGDHRRQVGHRRVRAGPRPTEY